MSDFRARCRDCGAEIEAESAKDASEKLGAHRCKPAKTEKTR